MGCACKNPKPREPAQEMRRRRERQRVGMHLLSVDHFACARSVNDDDSLYLLSTTRAAERREHGEETDMGPWIIFIVINLVACRLMPGIKFKRVY
jgi:hypothetical protein